MKKRLLFMNMIVLVSVIMFSVSSCTKIKDDINVLKQDVSEIQKKLTDLETKMSSLKYVTGLALGSDGVTVTVSFNDNTTTSFKVVVPEVPNLVSGNVDGTVTIRFWDDAAKRWVDFMFPTAKYLDDIAKGITASLPKFKDNNNATVTVSLWDAEAKAFKDFVFPYVNTGLAELNALIFPSRDNIGIIFNFNRSAAGTPIRWQDGTTAIAINTNYVSDYSDFTIPVIVSPDNANLSLYRFRLVDPLGNEIPNSGVTLTHGYNPKDHIFTDPTSPFGITRATGTAVYTAKLNITGVQRPLMTESTVNGYVNVSSGYWSLQAVDAAGNVKASTSFEYQFNATASYSTTGSVHASNTAATAFNIAVPVGKTFDIFTELREKGVNLATLPGRANFAKLGKGKIDGVVAPLTLAVATQYASINTNTLMISTPNTAAARSALVGQTVRYYFEGVPMGAAGGTSSNTYYVNIRYENP